MNSKLQSKQVTAEDLKNVLGGGKNDAEIKQYDADGRLASESKTKVPDIETKATF